MTGYYMANFDRILSASEEVVSPVTKRALRLIQTSEFLSPGDFFRSLNDEELELLSDMVEGVQEEDEFSIQNLLLISNSLANAEGLLADDVEACRRNVNYFIAMILFVSLHRKGIVDLNYEKLTFGEEMDDEGIVKLRAGITREDLFRDDEED